MTKNLVIVESPTKSKTIEKFLGRNYTVRASMGHLRDLPKSLFGVDIEHDFEPKYINIRGKGELIKELKTLAKKADKIYLASDMDREGEAIAWHLAHVLKLDLNEKNRIEFNAITTDAIKDAIKHPRKIDMDKVDAQQARRILDRLVGYQISPLLWKSVDVNTSAGRVQSAALKLICDLEDQIRAFIIEKYWEVNGDFQGGFNFLLNKISKEKVGRIFDFKVVEKLKKDINKKTFEVTGANINKKSNSPPKPLKTSTLQQLASSYPMLGKFCQLF